MVTRLNGANNAVSTLAAAITSGATSLTVQTGHGALFPAAPFMVSVGGEIIEVGGKTGDSFTSLLRGREGTTAAAHADDAPIENRWTRGTYERLLAEIDAAAATISALEAAAFRPAVHPGATGVWRVPGWWIGDMAGFTPIIGERVYMPIFQAYAQTYVRIGLNVVSGGQGTGGQLARMGIYNAEIVGGKLRPSTLLLDAGTVAIDTAGSKEVTINTTLEPGWYFLVSVIDGGTLFTGNLFSETFPPVTPHGSFLGSPHEGVQLTEGTGIAASTALPATATAPTASRDLVRGFVRLRD